MSKMGTVAIIDYGSGNLRSAAKAFERALGERAEPRQKGGMRVSVTARADEVLTASHIVLPGVGAFAACRDGLLGLSGLAEALGEAVIAKGRPFLGICVGMQLMASRGWEHGEHDGLGWIEGEVVPIAAVTPRDSGPRDSGPRDSGPSAGAPLGLRIPHMGWNELELKQASHPVLDGIKSGWHAYFVHSYRFACADPSHELARTEYGGPVTAMVGRDNMIGTQFHPEKSQATGLKLLANFLDWRP